MEHIQQQPIAVWSTARDVWETPQTEGLFCEHLDVFSETFPISGMTRNGMAYELPTSERHTDGSGYSSLPVLPTPAVNDMGKAYTPDEWDDWTDKMKAKHGNGNGHGKSLEIEAARLLPTPRADEPGRTSEGYGLSLNEAVGVGNGRIQRFGQYAAAIARWEHVLGRPAPAPTEPTVRNGAHRLSPRFTEWMMGLPDGWITDAPGITRNEALKACGNGVVPQQAAAAISHLLERAEVYRNV